MRDLNSVLHKCSVLYERKLWTVLFFFLALAAHAHADAVLLLEEPFGRFGGLNPTGHAAVYLTRICAVSPIQLRRCEPDEAGVVVSRYHRIGGYDWLAVPLVPYLYAVNTPQEIPQSADAETVAALRDAYRRENLSTIAPDDVDGRTPEGEWVQLVGSAYDRKIYGFVIETSPEQDDALIERLNNRKNKSHFNLFFRNCADFARSVLNFYYPHAVRRSFLADAGITTPKQIAKSLVKYGKRHPDVELSSFVIPQMPGSIRRSDNVHGVFEALIKSKKYVVPLAILHPAITGSMAAAYLTEGRFNPKHDAKVFDLARTLQAVQPGD